MSKLLIIDGNAIVHRAYHALPPLTDKDGNIVNAVYGFFSMLLKVIEDVQPIYVAVCFDRPAPTFRKLMFAGYHAHRPQMADGLSSQFVALHKALEDAHIAIYEQDGYEGDDIIGTLVNQAIQISGFSSQLSDSSQSVIGSSVSTKTEKPKTDKPSSENRKQKTDNQFEVIILTGDRDLLQLVNAQVKVLMPITGITKMILHDEKSVEEKYGITPEQFVDYKALIGDASDGYPGVTGIGPKTAADLLKKYTSFENLYQHVGELPEKIGLKLATDAEQAALAKKLATIVTDAPVHLDLDQCTLSNTSKEDFYHAWETLGFASLRKRLETMKVIKSREEQLGLL